MKGEPIRFPRKSLDRNKSGAGGSRTRVQTYPPQCFYMLIPALLVGKALEPDAPMSSVAGWSWAKVTAFLCSNPCSFLVGGGTWSQVYPFGGPNGYPIAD